LHSVAGHFESVPDIALAIFMIIQQPARIGCDQNPT
jgi:hypothetical protein